MKQTVNKYFCKAGFRAHTVKQYVHHTYCCLIRIMKCVSDQQLFRCFSRCCCKIKDEYKKKKDFRVAATVVTMMATEQVASSNE